MMYKIAVVVSEFNSPITEVLLADASVELEINQQVDFNNSKDIYKVPGAIELTFAAQLLATSKQYDAIILLGCVIKGETQHFDYVCLQVSIGTQQVMLKHDIPIIFGVLTTNTAKQALARADGSKTRTGKYCVDTALNMLELKNKISKISF